MSQTPDDAHLRETTLHSEQVFEGIFFKVSRDTVALPNGKTAQRDYIRHPGAVMIIAQCDDGRVVVERQYRHPVKQVFIEFPAGKIDPGEPPLETAIRELKEETGYTARHWQYLCTIHNAIGYADEHIDFYLATGLTRGASQLEAGEFIEVYTESIDNLLEQVRCGAITDVKTVIGTFWLEKIRSGTWRPEDSVG